MAGRHRIYLTVLPRRFIRFRFLSKTKCNLSAVSYNEEVVSVRNQHQTSHLDLTTTCYEPKGREFDSLRARHSLPTSRLRVRTSTGIRSPLCLQFRDSALQFAGNLAGVLVWCKTDWFADRHANMAGTRDDAFCLAQVEQAV
jgi:hypothetical protein